MKSNIKKRWVSALRSEDYEQGRSQLRNKNSKHCCLGVLADIIDPYAWDECVWLFTENNGRKLPMDLEFLDEALLSIGLSDEDQKKLIELNDDEGYDFWQIADWIEDNIPVEG